MPAKYTDLKLIDELCIDLRSALQTAYYRKGQRMEWAEFERHSSVTRDAMNRLRRGRRNGATLTLSLAKYFDAEAQTGG